MKVKVNAGNGGEDAQDFARMLREMYAAWDGPVFNEPGIHRFIRTSPFDVEHRRHTTFAGVSIEGEEEQEGLRRSYVLDPYKMVKDHSLDIEVPEPELVLGGDLSPFYGDGVGPVPPEPIPPPPPQRPLTDAELKRAAELAREHGWL